MPIVQMHLIQGYDGDTKRRLGEAVTDAIGAVIAAPPEAVTVMISEHAGEDYMRGRMHRSPAPALPDPCAIVRAYLAEMEARALDAARARLGEGFTMRFPSVAPMTMLEELIDWSRPRYRFVKKTIEAVDLAPAPGTASANAIVYVTGTLHGEWPDGTPFEGIRFIDRFELTDGLITRQDVWNDIAEERP
ncbi:tautomerase family protein [Yangia mangrovi]|uniref:Tautomerase n=1 Tax=Alloyangia mangrovi TaxID=1779329 RepID=A0A2A3JND8_9RHOB|nr:tautomerase family protein [Alloyangia mangrovi]MCT4370753.1 tautomerase family protein [Alloyangia mangrovi]